MANRTLNHIFRLKYAAALATLLAGAFWLQRGQAQGPSPKLQFIRGSVAAVVLAGSNAPREIALPQAKVFLVRPADLNRPLASTVTDLSGRFALKSAEAGPFTVCVEAEGFARNCATKEFRLALKPQLLGAIRLFAERRDDRVTAFGSVKLLDGGIPRVFQPHAGLNSFAVVEIAAPSVRRRTIVNNFGEYVIPGILLSQAFRLSAQVEGERRELSINKLQGVPPHIAQRFDFVLPNSSPRIRAIAASVGGKRIQVALPGDKVDLLAAVDDPEADKLQYRWILPGGGVSPASGLSALQWTAPGRPGQYSLSLLVTDNRGGFARDSRTIAVGSGIVTFSGAVQDNDRAPIGGAQVDINGRLTNTSLRGRFSLDVPVRDKYVMTIRKAGLEAGSPASFGTMSFVYTGAIVEGRWVMRPAQVASVDPTRAIKLTHRRTDKECVGSPGSRIAWPQYLSPSIFDWQDGKGRSLRIDEAARKDQRGAGQLTLLLSRLSPQLARAFGPVAKTTGQVDERRPPCLPGIQVDIPANSLEDPVTHLAPAGMVKISVSAVDLNAADHMPGDYSAVDPAGKLLSMESFGAGSVEIGAAGKRYNLKAGSTATVTIPVDGTQLAGSAALPDRIPFLYYDERSGVWNQDGEAKLATVAGGGKAYVKTVSHFSTMNADVLKSGQSCVAVEVDPAAGFALPLSVEVLLPPSVVNPNVIQKRSLSVDSTKTNAIYNLPNNTNIVLTPILSGTLPDGSAGSVPAGVFVVNTGGPQLSASNPPAPNGDGTYYAEAAGVPTGPCASRIILKNLVAPNPGSGYEFLQGLHFQSSNITESAPAVAAAIEQGAQDYYLHADPDNLRVSFNQFKLKNRFGQAPLADEYSAQYANSGDLGFGRDMHCRKNAADDGQFDLACYVTNYGQPPADLPDQADADNTLNGSIPDATVAMEYSRVESSGGAGLPDNGRAVKFYVYNTNQPDANRLIKADLDGFGERPVPQLCMICHGGQAAGEAADPADPTGPQKGSFIGRSDIMSMNSQFLPFDLRFFNFPASKSKASQQAAFKSLNTDIVKRVAQGLGPVGAPAAEVIDAWYAGGSASQIEDAVVANWDAATPASEDRRFYRDVFAKACRTCHIAQPFSAPPYAGKAEFRDQILTVQTRVCEDRVMPHAKRTHQLFWTSLAPSMPGFLQLYGQTIPGWSAGGDQCGQFFQGGASIPVFAAKIYPILATCSGGGCHTGVGNANFSVGGGEAATYTSLLTAGTLGGGNYIVANNAAASLLFQRISNNPPPRMPLGGASLATTDKDGDGVNDLQEILNWINAGAPH